MTTLQRICSAHPGKALCAGSSSIDECDRLLAPLRDRPVRLLHLGAADAASAREAMQVWSRYFSHARALVACCDTGSQPGAGAAAASGAEPHLTLIAADPCSEHGFGQVTAACAGFDIVIVTGRADDDRVSAAFARYFPLLADGGLFLVDRQQHAAPAVAVRIAGGEQGQRDRDDAIGHATGRNEPHEASGTVPPKTALSEVLAARYAMDVQLAQLKRDLANRERQLAELRGSAAGRAAVAMQSLGYQMKRVRRAAELVRPAIKRGGGLRRTVGKALQLYRRSGFQGITRGFRFVATGSPVGSNQHRNEDRFDYREWVRRYDTINDELRARLRERVNGLGSRPLISVLMPTYNADPAWLVQAIESVRAQIYPHWQLCIADDASTSAAVRPLLERYAREDERIEVVFRTENGHISAASNSALELARGEWVALLDHDDLLSEHALFWVAEAIDRNPGLSLIYSDEDKIDADGARSSPYFKCDWNPELFHSHNMVSHLGVYRTELMKQIGGFRPGLEGAQDYDLALRFIERIEPAQIHHVPRVLYHWRVHRQSTAQSAEAKPYAFLAGERALNQHFERTAMPVRAEFAGYGYRLHHALPASAPLVTLIIPTRNGLNLLRQCVSSVMARTTYAPFEIIVVDNGSDDLQCMRYLEQLRSDPRIRVLRDDSPFNYSALNNAAARLARGSVLCLLNNDIEVITPEWLAEMVAVALQPGIGAVGARLLYPDGTLQHGGVILGLGGIAGHSHKHLPRGEHGYFGRASLLQDYSAVTGACLVVRKAVYEQVGGLNEHDLAVAFNDVDFCLRLREAGYRNVWTPFAELFHHESATRGDEMAPDKRERFARETAYMEQRWSGMLWNDPAYSPNLSLSYDDFSLAWPPRVDATAEAVAAANEGTHR